MSSFPFCFPQGVYSRGANKSSGDAHHPNLLPEKEVSGDHWFLQELHCGGDRGRRHVFLRPDGHQAAWTPCGEGRTHRHTLTKTHLKIPQRLIRVTCIRLYICGFTLAPPSVVDVGGKDGGVYLPAGRGREDRVVFDALCHHQPSVAASPGDHTLHQPAERASSQGGHFWHTSTLTVRVRGRVIKQLSCLSITLVLS